MSAFAESLRSVRTALAPGGGRVAITSALPNEGKTSVAASLARIMALSGERVVLVDCDLRRSTLSKLVRGEPSTGLMALLAGEARLEDVLVRDKSGLDLLPLAASAFTPQDVLGGEAMAELLRELSARYDRVVLDAPPVLSVVDARTVCALADQTVVVVRWGRTQADPVRATLDLLEQDGVEVAGVVMNRVDLRDRRSLGGKDPARYYGRYQAYYQN